MADAKGVQAGEDPDRGERDGGGENLAGAQGVPEVGEVADMFPTTRADAAQRPKPWRFVLIAISFFAVPCQKITE
ncbi:MAG TPA: hypothetical protein VE198_19620 [Actinoallomurus sp.]|nr:hypothetical protein [Actinoallomurus sp.]